MSQWFKSVNLIVAILSSVSNLKIVKLRKPYDKENSCLIKLFSSIFETIYKQASVFYARKV